MQHSPAAHSHESPSNLVPHNKTRPDNPENHRWSLLSFWIAFSTLDALLGSGTLTKKKQEQAYNNEQRVIIDLPQHVQLATTTGKIPKIERKRCPTKRASRHHGSKNGGRCKEKTLTKKQK